MLDTGDVNAAIDDYANRIKNEVLGSNIPFVADQLIAQAEGLLADLEALKSEITAALGGSIPIGTPANLQALADLINTTTFLGGGDVLTASVVGDDLALVLDHEAATTITATLDAAGSVGFAADAIDLDASLILDADARFSLALLVDGDDGSVSVDADAVSEEFGLSLEGDLTFAADAMGALGFLDISVSDAPEPSPGEPAPPPDVDLDLTFDLKGDGIPSEVTLNGRAAIDARIETAVPVVPVLPGIEAVLLAEFTYADASLTGPGAAEADLSLALQDVRLRLDDLADVLGRVLGTVDGIVDTFPIGQIVDLLTERLPVIDDIAPDFVDVNDDGKISLRDVITLLDAGSGDAVFGFLDAVVTLAEVIEAVEELAEGLEGDDATLDIGTLMVADGAAQRILDGDAIPDSQPIVAPGSDLLALGTLIEKLGAFADIVGLREDGGAGGTPFTIAPLAAEAADDAFRFLFPFLESPEALAEALASILFNGFDAPPVTLVEADLPELSFSVDKEIPVVLSPFVGYFGGEFTGKVDFDVGYDTAAFADGFDFAEGFFISPDLPAVPAGPGDEAELKQPVGSVSLGAFAGGGLDILVARASVEGGLLGTVEVFLGGADEDGGKVRLSEVAGCFFDEIAGRLTVGLDVVFKIGFSIFSVEKRVGLAEVTLAQFDIDPCNPPPTDVNGAIEIDMSGLAFDDDAGTLTLNVGDRADLRALPDDADAALDEDGDPTGTPAVNEVFAVTRPPDGRGQSGRARRGRRERLRRLRALRHGGSGHPGGGGRRGGDDALTLAAGLAISADLSGGAGRDTLEGGALADVLDGGAGDDVLRGGAGEDILEGGAGNDILDGGADGDAIDGGEGAFDQIDYSGSGVGVSLAPSDSDPLLIVGSGGEAEGDTVRGVEYFIGSAFSDTFFGSATQTNTFEGGAGDDLLVGGAAPDLFIGGAGADTFRGNRAGEADTPDDAASYVFSPAGVIVILPSDLALGGEATGDSFEGIEDFQLTRFADRFVGTDAANLIDAYDGDDTVDGGGGADTVLAGLGDDRVEGGLDGDTLDGGGYLNFRPGQDWLSYAASDAAVTVDLIAGAATGGGGQDVILRAQAIGLDEGGGRAVVDRDPDQGPRLSSFENVRGSRFADAITGDDGRNVLEGGAGDDALDGGEGRDTLIGGSGGDALIGGGGIDLADYDASPDGVVANLAVGLGAFGHATGDSYDGIEDLRGSRFRDVLMGDAGDNRLDPNGNAGPGSEVLEGGAGTDTAVLDYAALPGSPNLRLALGADGDGFLRRVAEGTLLVEMTDIEDVEVTTGEGDDRLSSSAGGDDVVRSGGGDDTLSFGVGLDYVFAGAGADVVRRLGTAGLDADGNRVALPGLDASFLLDGGAGVDGLGLDLSYRTDDVTLFGRDPDEGRTIEIRTAAGGVARNFETLVEVISGSGDDALGQLGDVDTTFHAGAGVDVVTTGFGFDFATGGNSDVFDPDLQPFDNDISGAFIKDRDILVVDYSSTTTGWMSTPDGSPNDIVRLSDGGVILAEVNHREFERLFLTGTGRDDRLVGADLGLEAIKAPNRGDRLDGRGGDDVISGRAGDDLLRGGEGADVLDGGAGNDILVGASRGGDGGETDLLTGGEGRDTFVLGTAAGLHYGGGDNGALILDFDPSEGDQIALTGRLEDYVVTSDSPGSEATVVQIALADADGEAGRVIARAISTRPLDADGTEFVYDIAPRVAGERLFVEVPDFPLPIFPLGDAAAGAAPTAEIALPTGLFGGASRGASAPLAALEAPASSQVELALPLWRAGLVDDGELVRVLGPRGPAPSIEGEAVAATVGVPAFSVETADPVAAALDILSTGVSAFGTVTGGRYEGEAAAAGTFADAFGFASGAVLSTGRVAEIPGRNAVDGEGVTGPRPGLETALDFVEVGPLGEGTLYRAELPDVSGGIASIRIDDDGDYLGGAEGRFSAFDLDAITLSRELVKTTAGLDQAKFNALSRLELFDFTQDAVFFEPGVQRAGRFQDRDLVGSVNGLVDLAVARLDLADNTGGMTDDPAGIVSLGEGGSLGFDLTAPVRSSAGDPVFLYVVEAGGVENLEGVVQVSSEPIGVAGDLSTDLGRPGAEDDEARLTMTFEVEFDAADGPAPDFAEYSFEELFQVVIAPEELPERGGALSPDLFGVRVNGVDAITTAAGVAVTMDMLAFSPFGGFDPSLTLNPAGDGPLSDTLRADAYTAAYTVSGPIVAGTNVVEVFVSDEADGLLDTAIFLAPLNEPVANTPPVAADDVLILDEDARGTVDLLAGPGTDTDLDGDPLAVVSLVFQGEGGPQTIAVGAGEDTALAGGLGAVRVGAGGQFEFQAGGFFDALSSDGIAELRFSYTVSDGEAADEGEVVVTVLGVNDAPVAGAALRVSTPENALGAFDVSTSDPEGDPVSYRIAQSEDGARFVVDAAGTLSFRAPPDFKAPADGDANNVYELTVIAGDGMAEAAREVRIEVLDVGEGGTGDRAVIRGTDASDSLSGTAADEALVPLAGAYDRLTGGGGADDFVFGPETANGRRERDAVLDYDAADGDRIVLSDGISVVREDAISSGVVLTLSGDGDLIYVRGDSVAPGAITVVNEDFLL